jgi:Type I phosphodiesterase / nucleotide pyrophosphatase
VDRLLVCFIRGMDFRRIQGQTTPYISDLLRSFPWARITTIPTPELTQTIFTGQYPHEHGMWEVELKSDSNLLAKNKIVDKIPDSLTTTFQCLIHLATKSFDLAAIPPWRRRRFKVSRYKYFRKPLDEFFKHQKVVSIFDIIGTGKFIHLWTNKYNDMNTLLTKLFSDNLELVWVDLYFLDQLQHWYLDDAVKIRKFYRGVDQFVEKLYAECQKSNVSLMLLSDHGMEPVKGTIDIKSKLKKFELSSDEYTYFIEASVSRFWFHTERARSAILSMLSSIQNGRVQSYEDLQEYNIKFPDSRYGEFYFRTDPGYIIFPHDFYQPLANLYLGLTDWQQRSRIFNPKHRGYHGYPPNYESEKGLMMLLDDRYKMTDKEVEIIDVAPTVLGLVGYKKPDYMKGKNTFEPVNFL